MIWIAALFLMQQAMLDVPAESNPYTSEADVAQGKKLYAGRCAGCHGPAGDGGKGANLAVSVLPRAAEDRTLYLTIRYGIPETEMPSSLMSTREIWQVAAFVRTLGRLNQEAVSGNAQNGQQIVKGKGGCLQCHSIGLEGGRMGPSLSDVGVRRSPGHLRAKMLEPSSDVPEQFRVVALKTKSGQALSGIRLNEDSWSIQMRANDDQLHSFWKTDLTDLKVERRTLMPSYKNRLTAQEINDVVNYLSGLRGVQ